MENLMESYKGRLAISEKFYAQNNNGAKLSNTKKMITAQCLKNTAALLNESFVNSSSATQRGNLGMFKKFCLDITTIVMPNLVASDLLMTKPMSSFTGYLTYLQFGFGETKGGIEGGTYRDANGELQLKTVSNDPWTLGKWNEDRVNYTSEAVVETAGAAGAYVLSWTPVVKGAFIDASKVKHDVKITHEDGSIGYADVKEDGVTIDGNVNKNDRIAYRYDNVQIPQAKLPKLIAIMKGITLEAKARRIAIEYSQLAAFQSKQDYGIDFESTIAEQAQAELQQEIDNEAVLMLAKSADDAAEAGKIADLEWVDEELDTIAYSLKAEGFARKLEQAKMDIYKRTQKISPNWMLVSPDMMPILTFVPGFKAAGSARAVGPFVAGDINGLKVIVSPALGEKVCYLGVLGNDGKTATGVFAPYAPLIPTQLLGFADGTMSQGFSSMYDMKVLNDTLMTKIHVITGNGHAAIDNYPQSAEI